MTSTQTSVRILRRAIVALLCWLPTTVCAQPWQWPAYSLFRSESCDRIRNELLCARAIEGAQILAGSRDFSRRGDTLRVRLTSGERVFVDSVWRTASQSPFAFSRVSFLGVVPGLDVALVHRIADEQRQLLWIDRASGEMFDIPETPLLSPTNRHVALLSDYTLRGNELQIRDATDLTMEFRLQSYTHRFPDARWMSDDTLRFTRTVTAKSPDFPSLFETMQLARSDTGWVLSYAKQDPPGR